MTARDRLVISFLVVAAVLAGVWIELVSPERKQAQRLDGQVQSDRSALQSARDDADRAQQDKDGYAKAYSDVVRLGKAVPSDPEVPALIYEIEEASGRSVDFNSISAGDSATAGDVTETPPSTGAEGTASPTPSGSTPGSEAVAGAFTTLPFTFIFEGTFDSLSKLLSHIDSGVRTNASGGMQVDGRLLTIQGVDLTAAQTASAGATPRLTGTVTASAYTLPGSRGLTAGATSEGPTAAQPEGASETTVAPATPATAAVITAP